MPFYPNGTGEDSGNESLATCRPIVKTGTIKYVSSLIGDSSYSGYDSTAPVATIQQAIDIGLGANDIIVLMDGHSETLTSGVTISVAGVIIVGGGSSAGRPTVKLTPEAGSVGLTFSAAGCQLRNVWIEERVATDASDRVSVAVTGSNFQMVGCYIEGGQYDTGAGVQLGSGADSARIVNTTFISTAASRAAQPATGLEVSAAISDLDLEGVVFSNGPYGYSAPYAFDASAAAITRVRGLDVSMLLGADAMLHGSTTGYMNVGTATGGSHIVWTGI